MSSKLVGVWIIGAILLLASTWIIQKLDLTLGVSPLSYAIALVIAFLLILLCGLCWISVAVATKHKFI
jgi:hypothetical protein